MQASLKPAKLLVTKSTNLQALPPAARIMLLTLQPHVFETLEPTSRTRRTRSCMSGSCPPRTSASSCSQMADHLQTAMSSHCKSTLIHASPLRVQRIGATSRCVKFNCSISNRRCKAERKPEIQQTIAREWVANRSYSQSLHGQKQKLSVSTRRMERSRRSSLQPL